MSTYKLLSNLYPQTYHSTPAHHLDHFWIISGGGNYHVGVWRQHVAPFSASIFIYMFVYTHTPHSRLYFFILFLIRPQSLLLKSNFGHKARFSLLSPHIHLSVWVYCYTTILHINIIYHHCDWPHYLVANNQNRLFLQLPHPREEQQSVSVSSKTRPSTEAKTNCQRDSPEDKKETRGMVWCVRKHRIRMCQLERLWRLLLIKFSVVSSSLSSSPFHLLQLLRPIIDVINDGLQPWNHFLLINIHMHTMYSVLRSYIHSLNGPLLANLQG